MTSSPLAPSCLSSILLVFALGLGSLTRPAIAAAAPGASLLPDGSLELANTAGDWPDQWPRGKNVTWETEGENHFFRLTSVTPGVQVSLYLNVPIPQGTRALELSFRGRVSGLQRGLEKWNDARVILNFRDASGKKTYVPHVPTFGEDTGGWTSVSFQLNVPENAVSIEVMPTLFRVEAGTFDVDDLALKPVDPAAEK